MNHSDTFMKERPVFPLLMSMALPMVVSMAVNSLYNIVDTYFVAKISEDAMTALSLIYPLQNMVTAVTVGFGIGINAQISYHLGANDIHNAEKAATQGCVFSLIHGLVMTVVLLILTAPFLRLFASDEGIVSLGIRYGRIVFLATLIISLSLAMEKIFQAEGRMYACMFGLTLGCVTNIILDPVLIFGLGPFPEMGIEGAAIATVIGQTANLLVYPLCDWIRPVRVRLRANCLKPDRELIKKLYAVGIPATLNLALPSLLVSVLNGLLSAFAAGYIVVLGVYYKLQTFLYLSANGIIQGMRPIIGYNYGAGEYKRVRRIYLTALATTCMILAAGTVICLSIPEKLIGIYSSNPDTVAIGRNALRNISAGFIVSSISITTCGALEGLGKGSQSLWISLTRYLIVIIPAAFLLVRLFGAGAIWNAFWIAEFAAAFVSCILGKKIILGKFS